METDFPTVGCQMQSLRSAQRKLLQGGCGLQVTIGWVCSADVAQLKSSAGKPESAPPDRGKGLGKSLAELKSRQICFHRGIRCSPHAGNQTAVDLKPGTLCPSPQILHDYHPYKVSNPCTYVVSLPSDKAGPMQKCGSCICFHESARPLPG